jgi:capsular polysaccharide biosynthesis protein
VLQFRVQERGKLPVKTAIGGIAEHLRGVSQRQKHRLRFLKKIWGAYRRFAAGLPLNWLPVSSKYFGRPKGYYARTPDYIATHSQGNRVFTIFPEERIVRYPPHSLTGQPDDKFLQNLEVTIPATQVYDLHNVRYWGDYGGSLITPDDKLLADLSPDVWGVARHKILGKIKLPRCRSLGGTVAVISTAEAATNYWHWTFDLLPRIHLLDLAGFGPGAVDYYLVNHRDLPFQHETLAEMGIPAKKIVKTDRNCHFELDRAVTTSLKPGQFYVSKWICDFLFDIVKRQNPVMQTKRRLYVSRRTSRFRRVRNEAAVMKALEAMGFELIHPDAISVAEQRKAFYHAEFVVAPHGSGLTNIVYCQPGTRVVEVFPPGYIDLAFWAHSVHSQLVHWAVMAEGDAPAGGERRARTQDITINIEALLETIRAAELA